MVIDTNMDPGHPLVLQMVFGSTSDTDKILPGIVQATKKLPWLEVIVHWASADNTPEKVREIGKNYANLTVNGHLVGKPWISGAGMSNVLTGVLKQYADFEDLVIGVPLSGGRFPEASLLSTSEKPKFNAVLSVGYDNTFAAANIAQRFLRDTPARVLLYTPSGPVYESAQKLSDRLKDMRYVLNVYGLDYRMGGMPRPDDLVLNVIGSCDKWVYDEVDFVDKVIGSGVGIQVLVTNKDLDAGLKDYHDLASELLSKTAATGLVSASGYQNAVQAAATIMRDATVLAAMRNEKKLHRDILRDTPSSRYAKGVQFVMQ